MSHLTNLLHMSFILAGVESGDQCLLNFELLSCFSGIIMSFCFLLSIIPHSRQELSCLKSNVSYSSAVSLPIDQEESTPLLRQLKFWCE